MALQSPEMRALYDLKVFVVSQLSALLSQRSADLQNCDSDMMLARRIKRDIRERGRDIDGILDQVSSIYPSRGSS
jgi:uridine kinase